MITKFLNFVKKNWGLIIIGILTLSFVFSLGVIVGGKFFVRPPIIIEKELLTNLQPITQEKEERGFVASSKGKYYYPIDCPLAKNLSEKNKIFFNTKEEAESKGYIFNPRCQ